MMTCIRCQSEFESIGVAVKDPDNFMAGVNYKRPKCGIFYKDDEPVAVEKNGIISGRKDESA